jgi:ABC-type antimicrobial peptide transport system permease subunit
MAGSLLGLFGLVALALATMGIYGVMAHAVGQRRRELGVRLALGAKPGDLLGMVVKQGLQLTGLGLALGLVAALALTRLASGLLYGVSATDPTTFVVVPVALAASAVLASYFPGRAAMATDPLAALRHE